MCACSVCACAHVCVQCVCVRVWAEGVDVIISGVKSNFEVFLLHIFCTFPPLRLRGKYCTFTPLQLFEICI